MLGIVEWKVTTYLLLPYLPCLMLLGENIQNFIKENKKSFFETAIARALRIYWMIPNFLLIMMNKLCLRIVHMKLDNHEKTNHFNWIRHQLCINTLHSQFNQQPPVDLTYISLPICEGFNSEISQIISISNNTGLIQLWIPPCHILHNNSPKVQA